MILFPTKAKVIYDGTNFQLLAGSITANNGLTVSTANNVQLGGTLAANTDVALNSKNLTFRALEM